MEPDTKSPGDTRPSFPAGWVSTWGAQEQYEKTRPASVGNLLRNAREGARVTQLQAADRIGVARTTVVAIEQGKRKVRPKELEVLLVMYGTSMEALFFPGMVQVDLAPRFKRHGGAQDQASLDAVATLSHLAGTEATFEKVLGIGRAREYPFERRVRGGDVGSQAERHAGELRGYLGLGDAPVADMEGLLEDELDVRLYVRKLDGGVSGLYAHDGRVGACVLLNARHPRERRNLAAAHGLGRLVSARDRPGVLRGDGGGRTREGRYADAFARAFLMPLGAVKREFRKVASGSPWLSRRHVVVMADRFGVPREALVRRLEELGVVRGGTWDWFLETGGIPEELVKKTLGEPPHDRRRAEAELPTTVRLATLGAEAWRQTLMSAERISELLGVFILDFKEIMFDRELLVDDGASASVSLE